jgi:uncharacterized delta-60 repeat protein
LTALFALALAISGVDTSHAQTPGSTDITFATSDLGNGIGDGADGNILEMVVQPDGKILIAGSFNRYNTTTCMRLARLNADGTLDPTFVNSGTANWGVSCIALQPDGKVLAGGPFTTFGGTAHGRIVRTLANGNLDPAFVTGSGFDDEVDRILVQPDGRIVVAGAFSSYNGTPCNRVCRLLSNGSIDPSFNVGTGPAGGANALVMDLVRFPSGQLLLGGDFTSFNGVARNNLVLLNSDGSVSGAFVAPGAGPDAWVSTLAMAGTNRVLLGGWFTDYGGTNAMGLVQVDLTGAVDATFNTTSGFAGHINDIVVQSDGKVIAVGDFTSYAGIARSDIARLNTNGSLDTGFNTSTDPAPYAWCVALRTDGKVLLSESLPAPGRRYLTLLNTNGTPDLSFAQATGLTASWGCIVRRMLRQSDGKLIIAGIFEQAWNNVRPGLARLNANGTLDAGFDPGTGAGSVQNMALQADDKLLLGGTFTTFNGTAAGRITRLLTSGGIDASFATGTGFNGTVTAIAVQADGKILVAGNFSQYNGTPCSGMVRLASTGALDATFVPGTVPNSIQRLVVQPDGRILACGSFTTFNGMPRARIARLLANGTVDPSFDPGSGPNDQVNIMLLQPDGRILIRGDFSNVGGTSRPGFARLNANGTLDASFVPWLSSAPNDLVLQPNGKVLVISSNFFLRRLHANGDEDPTFPAITVQNIFSLLLQPDGKVLVGGSFTAVNGTGRNRIARLNNGDPVINVSAKAFLDGPYNSGTQTMGDALRSAGLVPLSEPYTGSGFDHFVGGGGESVAPAVLAATGPNAIVDWVVLELRSTIFSEAATRSALIQRDGDVVDLDGVSPVSFFVPAGSYFVAIRHRNHLGVLTAAAIPLSSMPTTVDFTLATTPTHGTDARRPVGSVQVLWPGNANSDAEVKYTGPNNDRDLVLSAIGGTVPTNTLSGQYRLEDINMDGVVKYTGPDNDRDFILQAIGGTVPTAVRVAQVP